MTDTTEPMAWLEQQISALAQGKRARNLDESIEAVKSDLRRKCEALEDAQVQIAYLHEKFGETGSGNTVLVRIAEALKP